MDVSTAQALLSFLQAAAAAPPSQPSPLTTSGARKRRQPETAVAAPTQQQAPRKQPRLDSTAQLPSVAAAGANLPAHMLQPGSQLALVLQLSGTPSQQQSGGGLPPTVSAVLAALPLAKKQELLLALLRKQAQNRQRVQPQLQPQPQQQSLLPTPTQRQQQPARATSLPAVQLLQGTEPAPQPIQQQLYPQASAQQQQRQQQPYLQPPAPQPQPEQQPRQSQAGLQSLIDLLSQQRPTTAGWLPGQRMAAAAGAGSGQLPPADTPQPEQRPVRPTPSRGSPSLTHPLFLRVVQERALAGTGTGTV